MKLRLLESAKEDLIDSCHFYEEQSPGLGAHFLDSLFSDIDSPPCTLAFMARSSVHIARFRRAFHLRFTTTSWATRFRFTPFSIAEDVHLGFAAGSGKTRHGNATGCQLPVRNTPFPLS